MRLFYKKRISKFFLFFVFFFLISISISYKAFAFDVVTSPSPLPDISDGNLLNKTVTFEVPLYSSDGYQVGVYNMDMVEYLIYTPSASTQNIQAGIFFSFPSDFVINGVSIDRELISVVSIYSNTPYLHYIWVPSMTAFTSSQGWTPDIGATTSAHGALLTIRPAGYGDDPRFGYYFGYRLYINGDIENLRSSFTSSGSVVDNSVFYNILTSLSYKNGIFLDYELLSGYSLRSHNSYSSPGIGEFLTHFFDEYFSNRVYNYGPGSSGLKFVLPYDYLSISKLDFLFQLQSDVEDLKQLKSSVNQLQSDYNNLNSSLSSMSVDISELQGQYQSLSSQVNALQSDLTGVKAVLVEINNKLSVLSGMNTTISNMNTVVLRIETALNAIQASIKDYTQDLQDIKNALTNVSMNMENLNKMFSEFSEVSAEIMNEFTESMTKLDSIDKKLEDLANSIKAPLPDVDVDMTVNNILSSDFDVSVAWIKGFFDIPLISILCISSFGLMLISYVFFGKKGS